MANKANADQPVSDTPIQGVGIGLRAQHYQHILNTKPDTPWFEALTDNYMGDGGQPLDYLEKVRANYPVTFHGVGMSLGSAGDLNQDYMQCLKLLKERFQPTWISDHLCWSASGKHTSNELLPLPYTEEAIMHMAGKIRQAQDYLGERILVENVSSYIAYKDSAMTEWEFINAIADEADCHTLFDVNNIYVNARNHGFDAQDFIDGINAERIREIHLAGYDDQGTHLLDTHGRPVHPPVWSLYERAIQKLGPVPTLIEWDTDIPEFSILQREANKADDILSAITEQDNANAA